MLDLLIQNGTVYDGTGKAGVRRNIGVQDGKIVSVGGGELPEAREVMNAEGLAVSPGFIDCHTHSDAQIFLGDARRTAKLLQGNTTEIAGQCGSSRAPFLPDAPFDSPETRRVLAASTVFPSYRDFKDAVGKLDIGTNQLCFFGHKAIRSSILGMETRPATPNELDRMKALVDECMEEGAPGMSTGLVYAPSCYSTEEELVELLKEVGKYGGMYTTHIRGEGDTVLDAIAEAIRIGEKAGVPVNISHFKCMFPQNYDKADRMLEMVDEANARGVSVSMDAYPYTATSAGSTSALPPSFLSMGIPALSEWMGTKEGVAALREAVEHPTEVWENPIRNIGAKNFLITRASVTMEAVGKRVSEYAEMKGLDEIEAFADLFHRNRCDMTDIRFTMKEENLEKIYRHPCCLVGSDGLYAGGTMLAHPRAFATFPRYLGRYVREKKVLPLEEAIHRLTGQAAERYRLKDRGFIRDGYVADITVFDPDTVMDHATYENPFLLNTGIRRVLVAGRTRVLEGQPVGVENGVLLSWK